MPESGFYMWKHTIEAFLGGDPGFRKAKPHIDACNIPLLGTAVCCYPASHLSIPFPFPTLSRLHITSRIPSHPSHLSPPT